MPQTEWVQNPYDQHAFIPKRPQAFSVTEAGAAELVFSQPAAVSVNESGRYYPPENKTVEYVWVSLGDDGSTSTVVEFRKNGTAFKTLTLVASDFVEGSTTDTQLAGPITDYLTVATTSAGSGAQKLTAGVKFA